VVDDLDGDLAGLRLREWSAYRPVEGAPRRFIDLGTEGTLELVVRFLSAGEVRVPDEEALAVVVGIDEPAGDVVGR
jgi:hypothetical protein